MRNRVWVWRLLPIGMVALTGASLALWPDAPPRPRDPVLSQAVEPLLLPRAAQAVKPERIPDGVTFISAGWAENDRTELAFTVDGQIFVLCAYYPGGENSCNVDGNKILRTGTDGRQLVSIAQLPPFDPQGDEGGPLYEFWKTVPLARGANPAWVDRYVCNATSIQGCV